jgi:hypothetical protein
MNRLQILSAAKAVLATGSGQPEKHLAICFAIDAVIKGKRGNARTIAREIQDEIMAYLKPHLTFRARHNHDCNTEQIQAIRHAHLDKLIKEAAK